MPLKTIGTGRGLMGGGAYADKVMGFGPIAYWPLWEANGTVAHCLINPAQNGTYSSDVSTWPVGIGIGDGNTAPGFDGTNDYVGIFSAAFDAAFNGATGTAMIWMKVANLGVWTDGATRNLYNIYDDANNWYRCWKSNANNRFQTQGDAGAGIATITRNGCTEIDWVCIATTWSDGNNADEFIGYWDGIAIAAADASLNNWGGGGLTLNFTVIGAYSNIPNNQWHGWLAHCAWWDRVLNPAEVLALATV